MRKAVFIAGGGTGGHIYPALAIAHSLRGMAPDLQIHFVGSRGGLESKIIPEHGFPLHLVPIGKLNHNVSLAERFENIGQFAYFVHCQPFSFTQTSATHYCWSWGFCFCPDSIYGSFTWFSHCHMGAKCFSRNGQ
ncbi:MAG: glycosyltransferase [Bdellovibrionales bacterium]|nr:glycosyltransferase [Bdellovibrionales bacterium]